MLKIPRTEIAFGWINRAVEAVAAATRAGTAFVFGYVGGGALPFDPKTPGSDFILAFQALPVVLVMSVLSSLLFYWRILPPIVRGLSWALERTLDVGGAAGLSTAANIFVDQVEAPLFIRPIAGRSTMCPGKRNEVVSLGLKSIVSGTLTTCLLGAIVGVLR